MMKINSQKIKTTDFSELQPEATQQAQAGNSVDTSDLDAAIAEIEQFEQENAEWLSEENLGEMNRIKTMLVAEKAAIENYGQYGSGAGGVGGVDPTLWEMPQNLDPYWNGVNPDNIIQLDDDAGRLDEDPDRYGEYMGTVQIVNSGDPANPTNVGFQMTADMVGIWGESRGSDIVVTVEYGDGHRESWLVDGGSVGSEPLIVSAIGLEGVVMDFSKVFRQNGALYLHGSEGDDEIRGSQSGCGIIAYAGDDMIWGGAGDDRIYGDEHYLYAGQFDPSYGGNDTVYGGAGNDIMYGGAGIDASYASDQGESLNEFEGNPINDMTTTPPDPASWFDGGGVWEYNFDESQDGMLIFRNESSDGFGGEININMDGMPGYEMAFGEMDSDGGLVITFVGDEGSFKVKYEDFFSDQFGATNPLDRIVTLNIYGTSGNDIINFEKVEVGSQVINIHGGAGEDIILGTMNKLLQDGLDLNKLDTSIKNGAGVLVGHVNSGIFAADEDDQYGTTDDKTDLTKWNGYQATADNGQIVITEDDDSNTEKSQLLCLKAPDGYTHGYITQDSATGDILVIMVKPQASGYAKTIVVRIDGSLGLGYNDILVKNEVTTYVGEGEVENSSLGAPFTLTAISIDPDDYVLSGGEGKDLIFAPEGTKVIDDDNEEIVWQQVFNSLPVTPPASPSIDDTDYNNGSEGGDGTDGSEGGDGGQTE